jgi:hypothetical protein
MRGRNCVRLLLWQGFEGLIPDYASITSTYLVAARYRTNLSFVIAQSYEYIPMILTFFLPPVLHISESTSSSLPHMVPTYHMGFSPHYVRKATFGTRRQKPRSV